MNDRELLELAAKAAGIFLNWSDIEGVRPRRADTWDSWDPLKDDGDALRLAVKLQLQITPGTYNKDEFTAFHAGRGEAHEYRHYLQDEFAATRRAIVRAAAEVGKAVAP